MTAKKKRVWSDPGILKAIRNPSSMGYEIKIKNPEVTFLGVRGQPDFANMYITIYPKDKVIELKSMKEYFYQFRDKVLSYERLINVVFDDMMNVYEPDRLRIVMTFNPRGWNKLQINGRF